LPTDFNDEIQIKERPRPCANLTEMDCKLLAQRARHYRVMQQDDDQMQKLEVVIITIQNERFALLMSEIKEFSKLSGYTRIPCCPGFVVGSMNLRGDLLTLFDIGHLLGLSGNSEWQEGKVVVYEYQSLLLGILVNEVLDIVTIDAQQLKLTPSSFNKLQSQYTLGELDYQGEFVSLLTISQILEDGELAVDEEV